MSTKDEIRFDIPSLDDKIIEEKFKDEFYENISIDLLKYFLKNNFKNKFTVYFYLKDQQEDMSN